MPWRSGSSGNGTDPNLSLIAENLVNTLGLLDSINEMTTTFQMVPPTTRFGNAVFKAVEDKGYGIQLVSGDLGRSFLRYKAEISQTETGMLESYSLTVGQTSIERQYAVVNGRTVPASAVTLRSDETIDTDIDDQLFTASFDPKYSSIIAINNGMPKIEENKRGFQVVTSGDLRKTGEANVFDVGHSNYSSLFEGYVDVERQTLVFPNDSLRLGEANKQKLMSLAERIDPETDLISVIGCSHGRTKIRNGNQILAEGRTHRVTESLMFAGLSADLILDEACWGKTYWDDAVPRRGVICQLMRLILCPRMATQTNSKKSSPMAIGAWLCCGPTTVYRVSNKSR